MGPAEPTDADLLSAAMEIDSHGSQGKYTLL